MSDPENDGRLSALKRFSLLRGHHAKLHVERDHMVVNVKRNIIASFQRQLGTHDHALKKAELEVNRLKRELELVKSAASQGDVDYDQIAGALEAEFDPRARELAAAPRQLEWANKRLSTLMNVEQTTAFHARYRRLAERLHPELRLDQSPAATNLWERVRETYGAGDALELEALELMAEDLPDTPVDSLSPTEVETRVAKLKIENWNVINEIAGMRREWPFSLANKLPDEKWLKSQREEYEQKTAHLLSERQVLAEELNRILDTGAQD
jgi:hypothetical protein